jgi:2'-5' RNA ligase
VIPPLEVCEPIQAIRQLHDRQVGRWPPHINLLYPFRSRAEFPSAAPRLSAACVAVAPFRTTLGEFRSFRHGSGRCTLWLSPDPPGSLRDLQAALQAVFPDCDELTRFSGGFTPHLSVGQFPSPADCERVREQLQAGWQPITFTVTEVVLLARTADTPFVVERRVPLGDSTPPLNGPATPPP